MSAWNSGSGEGIEDRKRNIEEWRTEFQGRESIKTTSSENSVRAEILTEGY
jgi:hypothetical protein